jgi:hypothetical protein
MLFAALLAIPFGSNRAKGQIKIDVDRKIAAMPWMCLLIATHLKPAIKINLYHIWMLLRFTIFGLLILRLSNKISISTPISSICQMLAELPSLNHIIYR